MEMLASGFDRRNLWLLLGIVAVALLSYSAARAADEFVEDEFFAPDECMNCNLYWHGADECVTSQLPRWYAGADVLVLRRDMEDDVVFATDTGTTDPALGSSNFKDEFDAGVRFFAGYAISDWYRIEGSYFGSYYFNGDMAVRGTGTPTYDFPFGDDGNYARIRYSSSLNSAELNLRSRLAMCPRPLQMSLLFGARFMKLDERFFYDSDGAVVSDVDVNTSNDMLGLQIGLMAQWQCHPRSWLDYELKGGVYGNRARYSSTSDAFAGTMAAQKDVTAFSMDMSLIFNYQLTPGLTLRFGYNAMWLSGVALGVDNVQTDVNLLTLGPPKLDHAGVVVYHGPSFGVVWAR
jgi:hypothetical protein